jgi:MoxR-like ATPase
VAAEIPGSTRAGTPAEVPAELRVVLTRLALVKEHLGRIILGQDQVIEQMLITLLCNGHALLEGVPGTAKTLAVRALAMALSCQSKRIQFTPDLMPSDIVGTNVFNLSTNQFNFHAGPVFTDLLLADEINRAPAKTQSALLEAMAERHSTVDGIRRPLSTVFTVFATQNPVEFEGTYPLPEAQQDRFLIKIQVGYPSLEAERAILEAVDRGQALDRLDAAKTPPVMSLQDLEACRAALGLVRVEPGVME